LIYKTLILKGCQYVGHVEVLGYTKLSKGTIKPTTAGDTKELSVLTYLAEV